MHLVHHDNAQGEVPWHVLTRPEELELACPMHVADGHGPIVDIPGQLLHWQLLRQCTHSVVAHPVHIVPAAGMHGLSAQFGASVHC